MDSGIITLSGTGEQSHDFMLVYASNTPEEFDWAINDRIDEIVEFKLPTGTERERLLLQYVGEYLQNNLTPAIDGVGENQLRSAVAATEGFSGREIHKLVIAWQAAAFGSDHAALTPSAMQKVLDSHVVQRKLKEHWNANIVGVPRKV